MAVLDVRIAIPPVVCPIGGAHKGGPKREREKDDNINIETLRPPKRPPPAAAAAVAAARLT